jgi:uncharacterized protein (DUF885 family)
MLSLLLAAALTASSPQFEVPVLFKNTPNPDVYWEALLLSAKNRREEAKELLQDTHVAFHPEWKKRHPQHIEAFFDKLFLASVSHNPQHLTELGLFEAIGVNDHNRYLNDVTIENLLREAHEVEKNLQALQEYTLEDLNEEERISYEIFLWQLQFSDTPAHFVYHEYPVNQMHGVIQRLTALFTLFHPLQTQEDTDNYIARLRQIPLQFEQIRKRMDHQLLKGILPPRFALEKSISIVQKFIEPSPQDNILYKHLTAHAGENAEALEIIKEKVYPAYRKLQGFLEELLSVAKANRGVWALPDGEAYYAHLLKKHTTTDMTAEEIHALGLLEVARIQKEITVIFERDGLSEGEKSAGDMLLSLSKKDVYYYPNDDEGRQQCLSDFSRILDGCREKLWPLFDRKPGFPVVLERVPQHEEIGAPLAYYWPGSADGSRPGAFYVNLYSTRDLPKYHMKTLAVHEAEPGHHFQLSLQSQMDIPILRKLGESYTAYIEGWALYTEKLAYEYGFYETPEDQIGHLQFELLRAARLVVDTGIHQMRWTREEAIAYLMNEGGLEYDGAENEVERYFVMPGQATAYKIGQLKILELRERAKEALVERFDIRDFHNVVLMLGAAPLSVLEDVVERYIEQKLDAL